MVTWCVFVVWKVGSYFSVLFRGFIWVCGFYGVRFSFYERVGM